MKGPRAILSSAIANVLGEYFDVDAKDVESTLLGDAKIVLRNARLREREDGIPVVPKNGIGKMTIARLTGCVDEATFSWTWSTSYSSSWVKDAALTITGAKFAMRLEHMEANDDDDDDDEDGGDGHAADAAAAYDPDVKGERGESFVVNDDDDDANIDINASSSKHVEEGGTRGGGMLSGYVERHVKMIIDALTLKLVDYELRVALPKSSSPSSSSSSEGGGDDDRREEEDEYDDARDHLVLIVGCDGVEVTSFGREKTRDDGEGGVDVDDENDDCATGGRLKQTINLRALSCVVATEGSRDDDDYVEDTHTLLESFSYGADIVRSGERFGGFLTGLVVVGSSARSAEEGVVSCPPDFPPTGMSIHVGRVQMEALMRLGVMLLSPTDGRSAESSTERGSVEPSEHSKGSSSDGDRGTSGIGGEPSSFTFPLPSISVVLFDESRFTVFGINAMYLADGTVCSAEVAKFVFESDVHGRAEATEIVISMRPVVRMAIGCVSNLVIPDTALLLTPVHYCEFTYEGSTLVVRLNSLDVMTYSDKENTDSGVVVSAPVLPCNININIEKGMQIKSEAGALTEFGTLHLYALKGQGCTQVAIQLECFRNDLLSLSTVSFCGTLPLNQVNVVEDFVFAAGGIEITSGHSSDEWADVFSSGMQQKREQPKQNNQFRGNASKEARKSKPKERLLKVPFASIADLKITIGLEAHKIGRIKDTSLIVKAYRGNAKTTSKELVNYYARACLSRVPDFISNAELLGLNVVDSTTGLWATWAGAGAGLGAFGAGAGVAAITAVDAIKGAVDAGKRSRETDKEENWKPGDFIRGLIQVAKETTSDGAAKRGKLHEKGNVIDWTVGATSNTTDYVIENKNKLGAAGAGGGGFLVGMALGGPIGAIVGGLVATATTGAALKKLDKAIEEYQTDETKRLSDVSENRGL